MDKAGKQLTIKYAFLQGSFWIGECCMFSFAAVYLQWRNFSNVQIGLVLSLASVLSILLQPMIAAFADKTKKITLREILLFLMILMFLFTVTLFVLPQSFLLIAGVYVLINALQFTLIPLFNSLAVEYMNQGIPMNYGLARGLGSISFAAMSYGTGIAVNHLGPGILLPVFMVCHCLLILCTYQFKLSPSVLAALPSSGRAGAKDKDSLQVSQDSAPSGLFEFFARNKKFSLFLVGVVFLFFAHNLINTYLINIVEKAGGNSANLGVSLSIAAALELPAMAAFIFVVKKIKCSTLLKISAFFFLVKTIIAWLAPNVLMVYVSMAFQMLSYAIYTPASVYYVNSIIDEKDKVKGQTMTGVAAAGVAGTIGNLMGGKLLDTTGVSNMLFFAVISSVIGLVIVLFSTPEPGRKVRS